MRRFNWFNWNDSVRENRGLRELQKNPEVTVRQRGVMEKCTYCVQRIRRASTRASREHRELRPDEVRTACQQACPTGVIAFGSLTHPNAVLAARLSDRRIYGELATQGTRPRTRYLIKLINPNPELKG